MKSKLIIVMICTLFLNVFVFSSPDLSKDNNRTYGYEMMKNYPGSPHFGFRNMNHNPNFFIMRIICLSMMLLSILLTLFSLALLLKIDFAKGTDKVLWFITVILFPIFGAVLFLINRKTLK